MEENHLSKQEPFCPLPHLFPQRLLHPFLPEPTNRKKEFPPIATVMWEQVKMPNRHFLRSDIFTVAIGGNSFFRLFSLNELNSNLNYCSFFYPVIKW